MGSLHTTIIKRLASSAVIIAATYYLVFQASFFAFICGIEVVTLVALYEFFTLVERKNIFINKKLALLCGGALPLFFYFPGESIIIGATILSIFLVNLDKKRDYSTLVTVAVTLLGILYVAWFFSFLAKTRCLQDGRLWVAFLLFVVKGGDAGAYIIGTKFGKIKLMKAISPNKTIEGAAGGLLTSVGVALCTKVMLPHISLMQLAALGLVLGTLAQIGDLVESLIKREVGAKDSGIIPGLGGILDVLDSILFTAPFLFYYLTAVLGIT